MKIRTDLQLGGKEPNSMLSLQLHPVVHQSAGETPHSSHSSGYRPMGAHLHNTGSVLGPLKSDEVRKGSENVDICKVIAEREKELPYLKPHIALTQDRDEEDLLSSSGC